MTALDKHRSLQESTKAVSLHYIPHAAEHGRLHHNNDNTTNVCNRTADRPAPSQPEIPSTCMVMGMSATKSKLTIQEAYAFVALNIVMNGLNFLFWSETGERQAAYAHLPEVEHLLAPACQCDSAKCQAGSKSGQLAARHLIRYQA